MSYERYYANGWQSGESGGTPITPEALDHMERGIMEAAPGGFGLGVETPSIVTSIAALDGLTKSGWYRLTVSDGSAVLCNHNVSYSTVYVEAYSSGAVQQTVTNIGCPTRVIRSLSGGVWGEWEIENPPMVLGVEYRTTKRYNGMPVYTKLLSFGALPNAATKAVSYNPETPSYTPIAYGVLTSASRLIVGTGYDDYLNANSPIVTMVGSHTIRIRTDADFSAHTATVWVEYTK